MLGQGLTLYIQDQIKFLMTYVPENQIKYLASQKIRDRVCGPVDPFVCKLLKKRWGQFTFVNGRKKTLEHGLCLQAAENKRWDIVCVCKWPKKNAGV
jgi:hypothetical protein